MSVRADQTSPVRPRLLHQQVMRRITPIVIGIFILSGFIGVVLNQISASDMLNRARTETAQYFDTLITDEFNDFLEDINGLALTRAVRQYALTVSLRPAGSLSDAVRAAQSEMLQVFDDLIGKHRDRIIAIRFIDDSGGVWGKAENRAGDIFLDTTYYPNYRPVDNTAYIGTINLETSNTFIIGSLHDTATRDNVTTAYIGLKNTEGTLVTGTLEFELAIDPIISEFANSFQRSVYSNAGQRRVVIFSADNRLLYDSYSGEDSTDIQELLNTSELPVENQLQGTDLVSAVEIGSYAGAGFPWRVVFMDNFLTVENRRYTTSLLIILGSIILCGLLLNLLQRFLQSLLRPVEEARTMVTQLANDLQAKTETQTLNLSQPVLPQMQQFEDLVASVEQATGQIQKLRERLEREAQRRRRDIEIAARIGRETATLFDINQVFDRAIELICRELGFYHAQIFLTDDVGTTAVLVRSRGEVGEQLIAQNHKIPVGSRTVIGQVTGRQEPIIVNDTWNREGTPHGFNALLPDTRAELGLPMIIGTRVIGALDIQSRTSHVFNPEDLPTFQLLADQLALAVNTARLINESRQQMRNVEELNRQYTRQSWEEMIEDRGLGDRAYRYNLMDIEATSVTEPAADRGNGGLALPISLRGEVIGMLSAASNEGQFFTEGDEVVLRAVADRVALAIENARLFQETQISLTETSILYQLSRYLNEASTLDDVLQAIIVSVMTDADGGQIWQFNDYVTGGQPEWMQIAADLAIGERDENSENLVGLRLTINDHPFLKRLRSNQVTLINDTRTDTRLDQGLQIIFRRLRARAVVIIPLNVRNEWPGLLMIEYEEPRDFTERDGRIFSALIDQAGVAIDNRLLLEQTEEARTRSENLYASSRIINTMQSLQDLVYAVVATSSDPSLDFRLTLLEGTLDSTGWPTQGRIVAESREGNVKEADRVHQIIIPENSPMRNREPLIIQDDTPNLADVSAPVQWIRGEGYRFAAYFPLFSANQPIALLSVLAKDNRELSLEDYEVYRAITGQMSTQLENRRLLERTEIALDETRRLYVASRAISSAQDSRGVYYAATEHLARPFMPGNTVVEQTVDIAVLLTKPTPRWEAPYLECVYAWSGDAGVEHMISEGAVIESSHFPVGRLLLEANDAVYFRNIEDKPGDLGGEVEIREFLRRNSAKSAVITPIQFRQRLYGVVLCQSNRTDAFNEQYARFIEAIADQLALAIENRQLFEESQTEARRAQQEAQRAFALAEAAQLANQIGLDFESNLNEILANVVTAAGYDRWALNLLDDSNRRLQTITAHYPDFEGSALQSSFDLDDPNPIAAAARMNRTLVVNDLTKYPAFSELSPEALQLHQRMLGKFIITPIRTGNQTTGSLLVGRDFLSEDLNENDEQLAATLATQIAVAQENRRLFRQAQSEQQTLRSVLSTLPAGVLVLDPRTLRPILSNEQADSYLGQAITEQAAFNAENYNLYRTGTLLNYPNNELPVFTALQTGEGSFTDDVAVIAEDFQIDLLVNAAPIRNDQGEVTAIVTTFSDISNLRSLENTLQENLRETVAVYEAQRQLSEASSVDEVLDVLILQLATVQPSDAYILLLDEFDGKLSSARELLEPLEDVNIFGSLLSEHEIIHATRDQLNRLPEAERAAFDAMRTYAVLSVPMRARIRNITIGWLVAIVNDEGDFTIEQERIMTQLGDIASTAIDNRYLIQSTRSALQETAALYNANTAISRSRDLEQLTEALRIAFASISPTAYMASIAQELLTVTDIVVSDQTDLSLIRAALLRGPLPDKGLFISDLNNLTNPSALERDLMIAVSGNYRALAAVNLRVKDGANGILLVVYDAPHRFTETETRYMMALSDSTSVVLDNLVLVEEIQSTLEETTILYQAGRSMVDAATPQQILDVVVDFLIQPHVDQVFIALLNGRDWTSPNATVEINASWNHAEAIDLNGVTLSADQFPAWRQLGTQVLLAIEDVEEDVALDDMERVGIQSLDARSLVIIPLRVPNRAIGALWISSSSKHLHTTRELRIYQSFGEQASLSMEASYLLQQTERRARQLQTSAEIASSAGNILDLQTLLPQVVDLIKGAFGYDHVQVFLMDEDDGYAWVRASTGEPGKQLLTINHKLKRGSESVIGQVTATGKPSIALDTADANVVHMPNPYLPLTRSEMALPLLIQNRVIGALDVQSNQPNFFTEDDVNALTTLAAQISIAIENARLYEEAQTQADRMGFLFEVTTAAAAAETLNETLQNIADSLQDSQKALVVAIYLTKEYVDTNDNTYTTLEAVAVAGTNQPLTEIEAPHIDDPQRLLSRVARRMQPATVNDVSKEPTYLPVMPQTQAAVLVPMTSGGKLLGIIVMEDSEHGAYDQESLQLLQALSGSVSAIVQSAQLLERLQNANEELRELDRLKSDFLANMSHELRTPLNSIIGFSRVMLKGIDGPLTEMQEQDLTTIYNSGQHLLNLINDILDQAKIAAGKMDLKLAYFDIKAVVEGVKSIGLGLVKDKPIQLVVEIAQTLPKAYGDEFRTRQVLINLVSNASKFTPQGSVTIRVYPYHDAEMGRGFVRIDVIDTGIGIDEKDIPLLFEAFRQVDSSLTRVAGGTGLGLPIARSLVEMQGGQMYVQSQVNIGSTFSITIPIEPMVDEEAETDPRQQEQLKPQTKPTLDTRSVPRIDISGFSPRMMQAKRQILLIEDNADMVDQFRRVLQREGFEVLAASIVLEAEAMASGLHPTLIVMDVNFQNGAGWDILQRLKDRDDTFDIPVVVVTLSNESERAYRLGAHAYIPRPFTPEDLAKAALDAEKESNTERILIIDDQPDAIRLLTQILGEHGNYRVFHAQNGVEGISMVARRRPDLIILDLRMPEMDGFQVLQELRSNPETAIIPVLVVTGDIDLSADEQDKLSNVRVLLKTGISDEDYNDFIERVQKHLSGEEGNGHK